MNKPFLSKWIIENWLALLPIINAVGCGTGSKGDIQ
jgi:hypothetical protein